MQTSLFETMRTRRAPRRFILATLTAIGILGIAVAGASFARYFTPVSYSDTEPTAFIVAPDTEFDLIVRDLKTNGFIKSSTAFRIAHTLSGGARDIEEGGYQLSPSMSPWRISAVLSESPHQLWVTFPPGWRKEQIAEFIGSKLGWTDEVIGEFITIHTAPSADMVEGVYFGDTYLIARDSTPAQVAAQLRARFNEAFAPYAVITEEKNVTWTEALIMASLIEREAAKNDKHLISGILWNRINDGMRLQVDATLQYFRGAPGNWWPQPDVADKTFDSPFNTYRNGGLPPHPIANPSIESIDAALNPQKTTCMYYLHDNDGQIHCSPTYDGHLANVNRYLR